MLRSILKITIGASVMAVSAKLARRDVSLSFNGKEVKGDTKEIIGFVGSAAGMVIMANGLGNLIR